MDERRYYGLDALRGGMMMLGIVLHAAMLYIAEPPPKYPFATDRNTAFAFDVILLFIHSFRMPTFFVLAGFFTSLLVEKRGVGGTLRFFDRASPWVLYVSQSAYWVFLVHLPLVFFAGWWLLQFDLPAAFKFLIVCAFASTVAFLTFHYWVQKTWVSDFLHGRRFDLDWPWHASAGAQAQQST